MPGTVLEGGDITVVNTASLLMELAMQWGLIAHNEPEQTQFLHE